MPELLDAIRELRDENVRVDVMAAIAGRLDGTERDEVVRQLLDAARRRGGTNIERALALARMAGLLSGVERESLTREALQLARAASRDATGRAWALVLLAELMSGTERDLLIREAIEAALVEKREPVGGQDSSETLAGGVPSATDVSLDWQVPVVSISMGSPLTAVLEIPAELWPVVGGGLLILLERIATAPARIARNSRKKCSESRLWRKESS